MWDSETLQAMPSLCVLSQLRMWGEQEIWGGPRQVLGSQIYQS